MAGGDEFFFCWRALLGGRGQKGGQHEQGEREFRELHMGSSVTRPARH